MGSDYPMLFICLKKLVFILRVSLLSKNTCFNVLKNVTLVAL